MRKKARLGELNLAEIVHLYYNLEMTLQEIAASLDCQPSKVSFALTSNGFTLRPKTAKKKPAPAEPIAILNSAEIEQAIFDEAKSRLTFGQYKLFESIASYDLPSAIRYQNLVGRNYAIISA